VGDTATFSQSFSFGRSYRLITPAEYAFVFSKAQRCRDRYLTVLYRENQRGNPRLGFAVAKKRISAAVGRNRVKRLARESFRQHRSKLGNFDIIILAQSAAKTASNADLFTSLERHWATLSDSDNREGRSQCRS
jgi:ribonuclease P protein component